MKEPFFSVILPVYNGERYLSKAIDSVLNQTDRDWDLVAVDDCSTDRTPAILEAYVRKDPRMRVIRNAQNLRIGGTLNRGMREARGRWLAHVDADDWLDERFLERMRRRIEETNDPEAFFSTWATIVDEAGRKVLDIRLPAAGTIRRMMPIENFMYHSATVFSKTAFEAAGGYPLGLPKGTDTGLWLRFFKAGYKLVMIPECLMFYRIHYDNMTSGGKESRRQYHEWRASLFLKQGRPAEAREELTALRAREDRVTAKDRLYMVLSKLPAAWVRFFMWNIRPHLRFWARRCKKILA